MTTEQLQAASQHSGYYIIRVAKHKTAESNGPCPLVLDAYQAEALRSLVAVKQRLGVSPDLVFTTHRGSVPKSEYLFGPLNKALSVSRGQVTRLLCGVVRKTIESNAFLVAGSKRDEVSSGISEFLMHSSDKVVNTHYRYRTDDEAFWVDAIAGLRVRFVSPRVGQGPFVTNPEYVSSVCAYRLVVTLLADSFLTCVYQELPGVRCGTSDGTAPGAPTGQ